MDRATRRGLLLALILATAGLLRFVGLGWGLRHPPHIDERYFVESTAAMIASGDWNHRFHEYPGLLFYVMAPFVAPLPRPDVGMGTYLAARAVIAAFGLASILLAWRLGSDLVGPWGGLVAASLLAVSPLEVRTAHMVRPDVALGTATLAALICFRGVGARARGDGTAGVAIGVATALKFSGALLAIPYVARRLSVAGARWWSVPLAATAALCSFALLSPASLMQPHDAGAGALGQLLYHYVSEEQPHQAYLHQIANYAGGFVLGLGAPALLLVIAGFVLWWRQWRDWLPLAVLPLAIVLVFSTADVRHLRHLLPSLGGLAIAAGFAVEVLRARSTWLAASVWAIAVAVPLGASSAYVARMTQPSTRDQAADWIETHLPPGARILTTSGAPIARASR